MPWTGRPERNCGRAATRSLLSLTSVGFRLQTVAYTSARTIAPSIHSDWRASRAQKIETSMKIPFVLTAAFFALTFVSNAQLGQTSDWWSYGGDAQRSGWEKSDQKFAKTDVPKFQLLWKMKIANKATGPRSLMAPVIVGNLI